MSLSYKIDFAVIFKVKNANPNGDPLNGNRPRINYEGFGEMSDVCIKRKMRDRLQEFGESIFVQSTEKSADGAVSLMDRAKKSNLLGLSDAEMIKKACEKWFDVRAFGQLFAFKAGKSKVKKGDEADQDDTPSLSIGIRGPVSIHSAISIEPVNISSLQITKSVNSEGDGKKKSSDTMGMKHRVDEGIYVFYGSINPQLSEKTGFNDKDAETLKSILPKLFENDASSARPDGSMQVLNVFWWKHPNKSGKYSSSIVHSSLGVSNVEDDLYTLKPLEGLVPEIIKGF